MAGMISVLQNDDGNNTPGQIGVASNPNGVSTGVSPGVSNGLTNIGATVAGKVTSAMTGVPGVGTAVSGAIQGKSPEDIATNVAMSAASREAVSAATKAGMPSAVAMPAAGYIASTINNISKEMESPYGDYGYALAKDAPATVGAMIGGLALGPIGAIIGGAVGAMFGATSLSDGFLGDVLGSRTHEMARDDLAGQGYSYGDIKDITDNDIDLQSNFDPNARGSESGIGGYDVSGAFTNPNVSNNVGENVDTPSNNGDMGDDMGGNMDDGGNSSDNDSQGGIGGSSDEEGDGNNW